MHTYHTSLPVQKWHQELWQALEGLDPEMPWKQQQCVAFPYHFSILLLSLNSHHLTNYLTHHLTCAPDLVPHDWEARVHSHDPVTDYLILTLDSAHNQACDLSHDTMWPIEHLTSQVPDPVTISWHVTWFTIFGLTDCILYWWPV